MNFKDRPARMRHGASLAHGRAHARDHAAWSRRDFMTATGLAAAGTVAMVGRTPVMAQGMNALLPALGSLESDKALVIIQLKGGFDGLNTVVPIHEQFYYDNRPSLAIKAEDALSLDYQFGMHPDLAPLLPLWDEGKMGVIHNVGYPDSDLSHFKATDTMITGQPLTDEKEGWIGLMLDDQYPDFETNQPSFPLAVEIGSAPSRYALGPTAQMGLVIKDPAEFYSLAAGGGSFDPEDVPDSPYGTELSYLRESANQSALYADAVQDAASSGSNLVTYPGSSLAEQLSIVSRLIQGGLGSHVYVVKLEGFDTHDGQAYALSELFSELSGAVASFMADLEMGGKADKVSVAAFSEFGRRPFENSAKGTDHGTSNPVLFFGSDTTISGGFHGVTANLHDLDDRGNPRYAIDFRSVYGSLLNGWLGLDCLEVSRILGFDYAGLPIFQGSGSATCGTVSLSIRTSLMGMHDVKRIAGGLSEHIPTSQPFHQAPWNYNGSEECGSLPLTDPGIVDWVLVGVQREKDGPVIAKRAALMKDDGMVVDVDGSSPVRFFGVEAGQYFVTVSHRNHGGVQSAWPVVLD